MLLFILALIGPGLTAQYVERLDVSVANIDVVVTDRNGKVVRGLTRDDFEVFENGEKQAITNFSAYDSAPPSKESPEFTGVKAEAPTLPPPQRLVVLYIDLADVPPNSRKVFFDGLSEFLDSILREGDLLSVLGWTHRVRVIVPPTADRAQVDAVLASFSRGERSPDAITQEIAERAIRAQVAAFSSGLLPLTSVLEEQAFQEFFASEEAIARNQRRLESLRHILASLGRADLQKTFIFASDHVRIVPGTISLLEELANTANAYGITIHGFHPAGLRDGFADASVYYWPSYSERGTYGSAQTFRSHEEQGGLMLLAGRTGGVIGRGANASVAAMERLREEAETYYSIGYRLSDGVEDKPRPVTVKVKGRGYRVRAQRNVTKLSEASRLRDQVVTNLYLPPAASGSPAFDASVIAVRRDGRFLVVTIAVDIPDSELLFASGSAASFSILIAAGREVGDASDISELRHEAHPPAEAGKSRRYEFETRVRPDTRRLSLAIRDNTSGSVGTKVLELPAMR